MGMEIEVTRGVIATLVEEATCAYPRECCGLLIGRGLRIERAVPAANIHPLPERHFEIDPQVLIDAHRAARAGGPELVGYYHSHPNGHPLPSPSDCEHAGDRKVWAIIAAGTVHFHHDGEQGFVLLPTRVVAG